MSQENVELVRSAVEAYNAGPEAYLAFMAEDIEVRPDASVFPEAKPFRGPDEFRRFLAEIDEGWEGGDKLGVIQEVFAVGDRVVTRTDWGGRGRASGIDLRSSLSAVFDIRDGQIIRIEFYFDHAKASKPPGCGSRPRFCFAREAACLDELQSLNGKQGTELADLIVHKITEAVNAISFK